MGGTLQYHPDVRVLYMVLVFSLTNVKHSNIVQECIAENTGGCTDDSEGTESIVNKNL